MPPLVDPPVIQHLREVPGLRRRVTPLHFVDQTQEKVVILCAVTFRALTAHRVKQRLFEHRQMADVVHRHQVFGGVVRLKVPHHGLADGFLEQRFVTVHKFRPGFLEELPRAIHRMGGQHIIVIRQRQIVPGGQRRRRVGVGGNAPVFNFGVHDARVLRRAGAGGLAHFGVGGIGGVRQHQLPVGGGLVLHAVQKFRQKPRRRVVQRR